MTQNTSVLMPMDEPVELWGWIDRTSRALLLESVGPSEEYVQAYSAGLGRLRQLAGAVVQVRVTVERVAPAAAPAPPAGRKTAAAKKPAPVTRQDRAAFGRRLREAMGKRRVTQSDLALAVFGDRDANVSAFVRGTSIPPADVLAAMERALGLRAGELIAL